MKNQFKAIVLLITFLFISYSSFGFNNQYIKISSLINDTGNMNEGNAITRRFESRFTVNLGTSTPAIFKIPATDAGTPQKIYAEAYISWRNNNTYQRVFSSSYTPVS